MLAAISIAVSSFHLTASTRDIHRSRQGLAVVVGKIVTVYRYSIFTIVEESSILDARDESAVWCIVLGYE